MPRKKKLTKLDPASAREQVFQQFAQLLRITQSELDRLESQEGDHKLSASGLQAILAVHRNALELIAQAESYEIQRKEEEEREAHSGMTPEEKELLENFQSTVFAGENTYKEPSATMQGSLEFDTEDALKEKSRYPHTKR